MHEAPRKSILQTLAYFDIFDYPLTREELARLLWGASVGGAAAFADDLDRMVATGQVGEKFGYYFLPGRESTVAERRARLLAGESKYKRALRAARLIRSVPFLRAIFICNSVGFNHARPESDIDFFIITEPGRIWIVRFFTNFILRLFCLRTYGDKRAGKICLSFFIDARHLNFELWRVNDDDVYLAYWIAHLVPLYDPKKYLQSLVAANRWLQKYLPNLGAEITERVPPLLPTRLGRVWQKAWEAMWQGTYGNMIEAQARGLQWQKMKLSLKEKSERGGKEVIIVDGIIKLHENDRRADYRRQWLTKI